VQLQVKICGINTPAALDAAIVGGASHVGFVHFPKSPRHLEIDQILALIARTGGRLQTVVLLVDPPHELVGRFWMGDRPDIIQLHGEEAPNEIGALRARFGFDYWKALAVRRESDFLKSRQFIAAVERVLFDAPPPAGSEIPGGNGTRIDWSLLQKYRPEMPWGLAGGLDAGNLAEAARITNAELVDVSSGVESAPGVKDVDKIAAFLKAASYL
jgi:phosphoribosylanthranilate isomerase